MNIRRVAVPASIVAASAFVLLVAVFPVVSGPAEAATADARVAYAFDEGAGSAVSDASPAGNTGQLTNTTWVTGRSGGAASFDGTRSRVTSTAAITVGTTFSITVWILDPSAGGYETIVSVGTQRDIYLLDGRLWLFDGTRDIDLATSIPTGRWVHLGLTSDGTTMRTYVDGAAVGSVAARPSGSSTDLLQIGAWPANGSHHDFFSGLVDDVRWYDRALTPAEVSSDMTTPVGGVTPPATTTTPATTTAATTTTTTTVAPAGARSLRFYGNGRNGIDRVRVPLTPNRTIDVGGDFTLEWWMKVAGPLTNASCGTGEAAWIYGNILIDRDVYGGGDNGDYGISLFGDGVGTIAFGVTRGSRGATVCSTVGVDDGAWHHVAVTRSATSGTLAIFVDGRKRGTAAGPTGDVSYRDGRSGAPDDPYLVIGAEKHDAGSAYPSYRGWFDELRVSSVVRYTTDFTVPSGQLAVDADTVALYHLNEGTGTTMGDATGANPGTLLVGGSPTGPQWTSDAPS